MTSKLGMHWIRTHPDQLDYSHVERMQYKSTKLFEWHWSDRDACNNLLAVLPKDAYILARDHPMSEQKGDMWADPIGTGTRHANEWALKVASGNVHTPTDRTFFLGINEPDATNGDRTAIDRYNTSFLDRLRVHGLRGGAFNFSTGHPRTVDGTPNTKADYTVFEGSHQAIVRGHHIAVAHIYGSSTMPCAPGHYDRLKSCTWQDVEWVIGEMGSDEHVTTGGAHDGYLRTMNPPDYCRWLDELILGINDPRIHSYQVFTYDYSHPWDSFDVRPIRDALEAYDWQHVKVATTPPFVTHLPDISGGTKPVETLYVNAPSGANVRAEPDITSQVLVAVPYGASVDVIGNDNFDEWLPVRYGDTDGWMHQMLLSGTPVSVEKPQPTPTPPPQPTPQGIIEPRVAQAIMQIESGGRTHGENGKPIIRFESHIFRSKLGNDALWSKHFRADPAQPWTNQLWRPAGGEWRDLHPGGQAAEYAAFEFAKSLNADAAYQSISVGAPQIMGFNHARVGYPSAQAMYESFQNGPMQTIGFINFLLSDPALFEAVRNRDWREIARRYNGSGQVETYAPLLQKAYEGLG